MVKKPLGNVNKHNAISIDIKKYQIICEFIKHPVFLHSATLYKLNKKKDTNNMNEICNFDIEIEQSTNYDEIYNLGNIFINNTDTITYETLRLCEPDYNKIVEINFLEQNNHKLSKIEKTQKVKDSLYFSTFIINTFFLINILEEYQPNKSQTPQQLRRIVTCENDCFWVLEDGHCVLKLGFYSNLDEEKKIILSEEFMYNSKTSEFTKLKEEHNNFKKWGIITFCGYLGLLGIALFASSFSK